jgi:hypothetical protein
MPDQDGPTAVFCSVTKDFKSLFHGARRRKLQNKARSDTVVACVTQDRPAVCPEDLPAEIQTDTGSPSSRVAVLEVLLHPKEFFKYSLAKRFRDSGALIAHCNSQ